MTTLPPEIRDLEKERLNPATRIDWIDYARGLAIFLVVTGHTLPGLINGGILAPSLWSDYLYNWIYAFHMPLFFALSGLFALKTGARPWPRFWRDKFQGIIYPYLVWATLQTLLMIALSQFTNHSASFSDLYMLLFAGPAQFWFLHTLFLLMVIHALCIRLKIGPWPFFFLFTLLYLLHGHIADGGWRAMHLVQIKGLYFAAGIVFTAVGGKILVTRLNQAQLVIVAALGFTVVVFAVQKNLQQAKLLEPLVAAAGSAGILSLAVLLSRSRRAGFIAYWGEKSLEIYVAHTIMSAALRMALQRGLGIEHGVLHLILGIAAGIGGPLALVWFAERMGFPWIFTLRDRTARTDLEANPARAGVT